MVEQEELLDKNNILTEQGKKLLKLGLQDNAESIRFFNLARNDFGESRENLTKVFKVLLTDILPIENQTKEKKEQSRIIVKNVILSFVTKLYSDFALMFDISEIINSNNIENSKNIEDLTDALSKNDKVRDDAIRVIIEKHEKNREDVQYAIKKLS